MPPRIALHPGMPIRPIGLSPDQQRGKDAILGYSHSKNSVHVGGSASSSSSSSLSSPSQTTSSGPVRPKIWSLADVATSSDSHGDRKSPVQPHPVPPQLQPSHAGPIRPQHHIGGHSGLAAGLGRSWAAAAAAANGLSHPYSLAPHFLGLHRDPTTSVGGFMSSPNTSAILSRFGFAPMSMSTSSALVDHKRLQGGAPVPTPANR